MMDVEVSYLVQSCSKYSQFQSWSHGFHQFSLDDSHPFSIFKDISSTAYLENLYQPTATHYLKKSILISNYHFQYGILSVIHLTLSQCTSVTPSSQ